MTESLTQNVIVEPDITYRHTRLPIETRFDWAGIRRQLNHVEAGLAESATFLVEFYSEQRLDLTPEDRQLLTDLDTASRQEAEQSGKLLHYFADEPNPWGQALSWCLWNDRRAAAETMHGENHRRAIKLARSGLFYTAYDVKAYEVTTANTDGFAFTPIPLNHKFIKQENNNATI